MAANLDLLIAQVTMKTNWRVVGGSMKAVKVVSSIVASQDMIS